MGWIAGSYGITTNIGLITSVVDNVTIEILNNKLTAKSLISLPSGSDYNTMAGTDALISVTTGYSNTAFGHKALTDLTSGNWNTAVGSAALANTTTNDNNTAIGFSALTGNITGFANTAVGSNALGANNNDDNVAVGYNSLVQNTSGTSNTCIGSQTLYTNLDGSYNTCLGYFAGYSNGGSGNVFIGYEAGYNETGSNLLYISNSNTSTPLIYGNFSSATLKINGTLTPNGIRENIAAKTAAYTLTATDSYITASASSAAFTITLPSATGSGQKYVVIKTDSTTNAVTLAAAGTDTIEGSASKALSAQYDKIAVVDIASGLWADLGTGGGI